MASFEEVLSAGAQRMGDLLMDILEGAGNLLAKAGTAVAGAVVNKGTEVLSNTADRVASAGQSAGEAVSGAAAAVTAKAAGAASQGVAVKPDLPAPPLSDELLASARQAGRDIHNSGKATEAGKKDVAVGAAQEFGGEDLGKVAATTRSNGPAASGLQVG